MLVIYHQCSLCRKMLDYNTAYLRAASIVITCPRCETINVVKPDIPCESYLGCTNRATRLFLTGGLILPTYSKALCEQHLGEKGWFYSEATPPIKESREQRVSRRAGTAAIIVGIAASLLTLPQLGEIWKPSGAQTTGERLAWAAFTIILWVLFFWFRRIRTAPSPRRPPSRAFLLIFL